MAPANLLSPAILEVPHEFAFVRVYRDDCFDANTSTYHHQLRTAPDAQIKQDEATALHEA